MKVPLTLQYALTQYNSSYLNRNLNNERFCTDRFSVYGRYTQKDCGLLRTRAKYVTTSDDHSKLVVVSKRTAGRITKRKGKRSGCNAPSTKVTRADTKAQNATGRGACKHMVWRAKRVEKARKEAAKREE